MNSVSQFAILLLLGWGTVCAAAAAPAQAPVVRVQVTYQTYDPFFPWQKRSPDERFGFGVRIDNTHVLTTESLVRNHTLIEIQLPRSGEKITAVPIKTAPKVNLALLKVTGTPSPPDQIPIAYAQHIRVDHAVEIVQIDNTSAIQRGDARIVKTLVDGLPHAPYHTLQAEALTDLNVNGEGAPVFLDDALAGMMISYNRGSRTGRMLPPILISRFIHDVLQGAYAGFASAGFLWKPLVNPTKRTYLGVDGEPGGILVLNCLPGGGAADALQPNDVILSWDGYTIDNLGFYEDKLHGRLLFPHLIKGHRTPGENSNVSIIRNGTTQNVTVPLAHRQEEADLIPENITGAPVPYLVEGGLVIRELTGRMLKAYGNQWQTRVDSRLAHLYLTRQHAPEHPGDRIVLLANVLPDAINIGYQHWHNQIITAINQKTVGNLRDVFRIVDHDGSIQSVSLRAVKADIVLNQDMLPAANQRIASQYRIPSLRRE